MKIRSEYLILTECIERGITRGYNRAYKHTDNPTQPQIESEIYNAVTGEISEYFSFDKEEVFE